jgi:uncharacterized DUF497 family protein
LHICNYNIDVTGIRFEWDEAKNLANQRKHGVSFEEASQVFLDPLHIVVADRVIDGEQRWQALGMARRAGGSLLLLVVAHTVREDLEQGTFNEVVRIISARRAVPEERTSYESENY